MSLTQLVNDQRDLNIDDIKASINSSNSSGLMGGLGVGPWKVPLTLAKPAKQLERAACLHIRA